MSIDYAALKTEIAKPAYSGMSEAQTAAALNTKNIAATGDVQIELIRRRLVGTEIIGRIDARAAYYAAKLGAETSVNSASEQALAKLKTAQRAFELLPTFEMSNAQTKTFVENLLANLVTEDVMSGAQRTALLNLASGNISRAEEMFGRGVVVSDSDVSTAKGR